MDTVRLDIRRPGARWLCLLGIGLVIGFLVLLEPVGSLATAGPIPQAQRDDVAYEDEMEKGRQFQKRRQYEEALKCFKRANEMRDKKSPEAFLWMAQAYQGLEAYKNVVETCEKLIELAGSDTQVRAVACNLKGIALQSLAQSKDQRKLREAEAVFREGLALKTDLPILHYNLGFTLMQQGRDPEGIAELQEYVKLEPKGPKFDEARKLLENPRRAREAYASEFSITTSDGEYITLEDLRGKVVLLDFWGTWCAPCVASVPALRNLHKRYEKEQAFVMIAISSDREVETWRAFTAKNQMVWPQYRDRDSKLQRAFGVRSWPTYVLIDHEGIMRFRTSGFGSDGTAKIEEAIRKALKLVAKAPAAN
ncbi:MAG TPA: redoxin domain-containing protein [Blastocatellia bacterium]|nr:redoxin domain-containing protein [Blastocatellia bacterium]